MARFQVMALIVGISIDKSIERVIKDPSLFKTLCAVYFFVTLLNFYHGKIATTENETYRSSRTGNPLASLLDYALNTMLIGSFLFIAYFFDAYQGFLLANVAMRVLDMLLVVYSAVLDEAAARRSILRAHLYWGAFDGFTIVVLLVFWHLSAGGSLPLWQPIMLLVLSVIDIVLDYTINRELYFRTVDAVVEPAA